MHGFALFFDDHSAGELVALRDHLLAAGLPPTSLEAELHLALVLAEELDVTATSAEVDRHAPIATVDLRLNHADVFPGRQLFLAPASSAALSEARRFATNAVAAGGGVLDRYSRDGEWVPHISLTGFLDAAQAREALQLASEFGWPARVRATALRLSEIPSLRPARSWTLGGGEPR